jgi:hypothetical protein
VFLRAKGKGVKVDTTVRGSGMVLPRLDLVEVGTLTLRETVLAVKLELSSDDRVLTPAVHIEGSLGKDERTSIRDTRFKACSTSTISEDISRTRIIKTGCTEISSTREVEETRCVNEGVSTRCLGRTSEGVDSIRESIDGISVVERLGTECLVKETTAVKRRAVINVRIRLDNPDKLLNGVVKVELDLVR